MEHLRRSRGSAGQPRQREGSDILLFPHRHPPGGGDRRMPGQHQDAGKGSLAGMAVLVVEDDFIVAFDMQTLLEDAGATVIGPATSLAEAKELLAKSVPMVALLDVNLNGEYVFPLVADLDRRSIPYLFATAYADNEDLFPEAARTAPRLAKPVLPNALIGQLKKLLG